MGIPSEAQPMESKNQQATASLVLGIASLVLIFIIGGVGIVAGLLALYAGVRGLRIAKQLDGRGQILSIVGMGLGVIGIVVNVLPFVSASSEADQLVKQVQADATHTALLTSEAPQIYQGGGFTLTYHADWEVLDVSQAEECQQSGLECLLTIGHPSKDGSSIGLLRIELLSEVDPQELDAMIRADLEANDIDLILEGPVQFEINGLPAFRVIYDPPEEFAGQGRRILQVFSARGLDLFVVTAFAPNSKIFEDHQAELEEIAASITFTP